MLHLLKHCFEFSPGVSRGCWGALEPSQACLPAPSWVKPNTVQEQLREGVFAL